jgi:hypothetical protein
MAGPTTMATPSRERPGSRRSDAISPASRTAAGECVQGGELSMAEYAVSILRW